MRRWALEWLVAAGPEALLTPVALVVFTALHAVGPSTGPEAWRSLFVENCQSLLPIAIALGLVPVLLRDAEHGTLEEAITLPASRLAAVRLALLGLGPAALAVAWLAVLAALWGPVAFGEGLFAALGPTLFLSGLGAWAALATGRATVGYLVVIGWPLGDLVLRLLGAFAGLPALQVLDVFAYRWPVPRVPWVLVDVLQAAGGAALWARVVLGVRTSWRRQLL
jgi:hypothetical protein